MIASRRQKNTFFTNVPSTSRRGGFSPKHVLDDKNNAPVNWLHDQFIRHLPPNIGLGRYPHQPVGGSMGMQDGLILP